MILKDHDGGIHFVHGGHHRAFPPHLDKTFGTDAKTAVRAATRSRGHTSSARLPRLPTLRDGDPAAPHRTDAIALKVEAELHRVSSAANLSGSETDPNGQQQQRRSMSVISDRTTSKSDVGDDDTQSHKGGSGWSTASGVGYAPYKPSALAMAVRSAAAANFDVEFHNALNDMPTVVRDERLRRLGGDFGDEPPSPTELHLDSPSGSPHTLHSSPGYDQRDATGVECLRHISTCFGVDASNLVTRALRLEEWLGLRQRSELSTPVNNGFSISASMAVSQSARDITLDDIEALLGQSPESVFELFVRLGAHDPDDPRAVAAAAKFATLSAAAETSDPSAPSSPTSTTTSRRSTRQMSISTSQRRRAPSPPTPRNYHYTQVAWYSSHPDEDVMDYRTRCVLPATSFLQDTTAMPKNAATCLLIQALPDLGLAVHWNGTVIVPPGARLDFGQFSDMVHLYRYLLARHDDTTLNDTMKKRLVDLKKSAASVHRHYLNTAASAESGGVGDMSRAKKSFVRAKSLIMKLKQSDFSASQSLGMIDTGGSPHHVNSDGDDENDDDPAGGKLTRGASRSSMRRPKVTPSFRSDKSADSQERQLNSTVQIAAAAAAHVGFGPTITAADIIDDESAEAHAILELRKRVEEVKPPLTREFPEASKIPPTLGNGRFGRRRRQLARVPSRLLRDSFTGVGKRVTSVPSTPGAMKDVEHVESSSSSEPPSDAEGGSKQTPRGVGASGDKPPFRFNGLKTRPVTYEPIYDETALPAAVPVPPTDTTAASDAVYYTSNPWRAAEEILQKSAVTDPTSHPASASVTPTSASLPPTITPNSAPQTSRPASANPQRPAPTPSREHPPPPQTARVPSAPRVPPKPRPKTARATTPPRPTRLLPQSPEEALRKARVATAHKMKDTPSPKALKKKTPAARKPSADAAVADGDSSHPPAAPEPTAPSVKKETEQLSSEASVLRAAALPKRPLPAQRPQSARPVRTQPLPRGVPLRSETIGMLMADDPQDDIPSNNKTVRGFELNEEDAKGTIFDSPTARSGHQTDRQQQRDARSEFHEDVMARYREAFRIR